MEEQSVKGRLGGPWLLAPKQTICWEEPSEEGWVTLLPGFRSRRCALAPSRGPEPTTRSLSSP